MTFEIERFEWGPGALEVSGRWRSDSPRRFRHVRLVAGRRRIAPMRATPLRATPDGHPWSATFPWAGDDAPVAPVLEAGHDLLVELPAPDRVQVLAGDVPTPESEAVAELREALEGVRADLAAERAAAEALRRELGEEREAAAALRTELAEARERAEAEAREVEIQRAELETVRAAAAAAEQAKPESPTVVLEEEEEPADAPAPTHPWHFHPAARVNGSGEAPPKSRRAGVQHVLELPRQPDDHVRDHRAPWPVRIVAVALSGGVLVMLGIILGAIF